MRILPSTGAQIALAYHAADYMDTTMHHTPQYILTGIFSAWPEVLEIKGQPLYHIEYIAATHISYLLLVSFFWTFREMNLGTLRPYGMTSCLFTYVGYMCYMSHIYR